MTNFKLSSVNIVTVIKYYVVICFSGFDSLGFKCLSIFWEFSYRHIIVYGKEGISLISC